MILVDTSVWIDHFRRADRQLARLLENSEVATHPFVIGEIAVGSLKNRKLVLSGLADLPSVIAADDDEVLALIDNAALAGSRINYLDAHLLASARLTAGAKIWTRDKSLRKAAAALNLTFSGDPIGRR
jgi:predicted nucleic acid-binding protein